MRGRPIDRVLDLSPLNWTTLAPRLNTGRIANVVIVTTDLKRKASEMASPAPAEAEELAALNKALTALGFTDDVKLERFLHVLMPRVIDQMASKHESTKRKVLEILSHVNKRIKAVPAMPLPLEDLTALYVNEERPPTVRNFALIYVEQAHARATPEDRAAQILPLLKGVGARPKQAADIICRLAIQALAVPERHVRVPVDDMEFMTVARDRAAFVAHALLYLMYQPNTSGHAPVAAPAPSPAEQAARAVANVAGVAPGPAAGATPTTTPAAAPGASAPPGMSPASVERVLGPNAPPVANLADLAARKLALLEFFNRAKDETLPPPDVLTHYLVAACDADHEVAKRGEELLRRRCVWDTNRPTVDLEDVAIVSKLYRAFLGDPESVPIESRANPASPALKLRLIALMCRSVAAANAFPHTVQAIFTGLYGAGTNLRMKAAAMELAVWVLRHATDSQLAQAAPLLFSGMIKLLDGETKGAAASGGIAAGGVASLRGFCYQALGQLATRLPRLVVGTPDLAARVFTALGTEPEAVRPSVQTAARSLASAYKGCDGGVAMAIEGLLLSSIDAGAAAGDDAGGVGARRLVAAQWARDLFPFAHAPARYLCVVACGDEKQDVREVGRAGLRPPDGEVDEFARARRGRLAKRDEDNKAGDDAGDDAGNKAGSLPAAATFLDYLASRHPELSKPAGLASKLPLPPLAMAAALDFVRLCVAADAKGAPADPKASSSSTPAGYRRFLERCMVKSAPGDLTAAAAAAIVELIERDPASVVDGDDAASLNGIARHFAGAVDGPTRKVAAKICGALASRLAPAPTAAVAELDGLLAIAGKDGVKAGSEVHGRFEDQDGALRAAGYVAAAGNSEPLRLQRAFPPGKVIEALDVFVAVAGCRNPTLAGTAVEAIGHVGMTGLPDLPRARPGAEGDDGDKDGTKTAARGDGLPDDGDAPAGTMDLLVRRLARVMTKISDPGAQQRAARAAGHVIAGGCAPTDADFLVDALFGLAGTKSEETRVAVGEALCFAFGGVGVTAEGALFGSFVSLAEFTEKTSSSSSKAAAAETGSAEDGFFAGTDAIRDKILDAIFQRYLYSSRSEERCAACAWLLALVLHTRRHPRLLSMLSEIQEAFGSLLGDQNELTQEMASRGVSVVYELGTEEQRKELLGSLMGVLSGESQRKRRVKLDDDTQVFQEGTIKIDDKELAKKGDGDAPAGSTGGGSLSTYKELCSIVTDIGQPDLIYKFMDLANYQAMLNSSKGAAYGFAGIAKRAGDALAPHLAKLLPKLYRMQHDPSPNMREAVKGIWLAVVDDPKGAVDAHFGAVMEELLSECGSRMWRARQSSASALAELLSGRRFAEVEPYLERVWEASLRSIDDIKETVREAGKTLCRASRGLTVRLCDSHHSSPAETRATIEKTLPMLLNKGLNSTVREVQALAMDVVMNVAKHAGSAELGPHIPTMVTCLLEALSSMEDSRLNYIEQHAPAIGLSQERLEHARLQSAKASPMGETLDLLMNHVDDEVMKELVPAIGGVLRSGVGLNTRAGAARFLSRLCLRRGSLVRPHAGKLFKSLLSAAETDKSASVFAAMVSAVAAVARHATEARVNQLVDDVAAAYESVDDDNHERRATLAAALALELSRNASDALRNHATKILPLAFVGRFDVDEKRRNKWNEVWEENSSGASSTVRLYLDEILASALARLGSSQYQIKRQGAEAIAGLATAAPDVVSGKVPAMLAALTKELPGRVWEGKESLLPAVADVVEKCPVAALTFGGGEVVAALVAEATRKKSSYREAALRALDRSLAALAPPTVPGGPGGEPGGYAEVEGSNPVVDFFPAVFPLLRDALDPTSDSADASVDNPASEDRSTAGATSREMEEEAHRRASEAKAGGAVAESALGCLATLCAGATVLGSMEVVAIEITRIASAAMAPAQPWTRRAAGLRVVAALARRSATLGSEPRTVEAWLAPLCDAMRECGNDPRVSQLRRAAAEATGASARALASGSVARAALVKTLEEMRDGDRAPDVRGAAHRSLTDALS